MVRAKTTANSRESFMVCYTIRWNNAMNGTPFTAQRVSGSCSKNWTSNSLRVNIRYLFVVCPALYKRKRLENGFIVFAVEIHNENSSRPTRLAVITLVN